MLDRSYACLYVCPMSVNRENVIWQSADGTWNRGFYAYDTWGEDHEWDVEYD